MPYIGPISITISIREGGDEGKPAYLNGDTISMNAIDQVAKQIARNISMRNANMEPTKIVEMSAD